MRYLTPADLIAIHELLLSVFGGMRGITEAGFGRLEAAAATPQTSVFGEEIYGSIAEKAAALCLAVVRSHPFSDGNKRVALVALDVFLGLNGAQLSATNDAAYAMIMGLARGEIGGAELAEWVTQHVRLGFRDQGLGANLADSQSPIANRQAPIVYLELDDILDIRDRVAGAYGAPFEIMTMHGLLSALAAPRRSAFGAEAFPTLAEKAAALAFALVQNHPFWDGNKRIASAALRLFLDRNRAILTAHDIDLRVFTTGIAKGALQGGVLAKWIRDHI
jgi:death-on-curing protein